MTCVFQWCSGNLFRRCSGGVPLAVFERNYFSHDNIQYAKFVRTNIVLLGQQSCLAFPCVLGWRVNKLQTFFVLAIFVGTLKPFGRNNSGFKHIPRVFGSGTPSHNGMDGQGDGLLRRSWDWSCTLAKYIHTHTHTHTYPPLSPTLGASTMRYVGKVQLGAKHAAEEA